LLCSSKNCSFLRQGFISFRTFLNLGIINCTQKATPNNGESQIVFLSLSINDNLVTICSSKLSELLFPLYPLLFKKQALPLTYLK
jgi:hypothetical protein